MKRLFIVLVFMLVLSLPVLAQEARLHVDIVVDADHGWPTKLVVSGNVPQNKAWLGISLYPYAVIDPLKDGDHTIIELPKGEFSKEIKVPRAFLGGSFEFGLWGKKVDKVDCTIDNCFWCKKNGFHLENSLAYKSGLLTGLTGYTEEK